MKKRLIIILTAVTVAVISVVLFAVNVSATPTFYNLWVGGERVTSDNLSGDGWKYESDTNTLVLNGFGIATWGYNVGKDPLGHYPSKINLFAIIYAEGMDLTIRTGGGRRAVSATRVLQTGHMKRATGRTPAFITPAVKSRSPATPS